MVAVMMRLTLMSLIIGNSFKFTTLVRISADTEFLYMQAYEADLILLLVSTEKERILRCKERILFRA